MPAGVRRKCPQTLVASAPRTEHDREIRSVGVVIAGEIARWRPDSPSTEQKRKIGGIYNPVSGQIGWARGTAKVRYDEARVVDGARVIAFVCDTSWRALEAHEW